MVAWLDPGNNATVYCLQPQSEGQCDSSWAVTDLNSEEEEVEEGEEQTTIESVSGDNCSKIRSTVLSLQSSMSLSTIK